jgi:hypothetical protein
MQDGESKGSKRWKKETKAEMIKGTKEDHPGWIDTLKE